MIDSAPGKLHGSTITFGLPKAVELCSYRSPGVDIFFRKQKKGAAVNFESREKVLNGMSLSI